MLEHYLPAASTYASDIDGLVNLIFWIVGVWFVLCQVVFFYFIIKFRRKPGVKAQYITGEEKEQKRWISIPHALVLICDVFIVYGAVTVWVDIKQTLPEPEESTPVRVIGQQWAWTFVHAGPDGLLDTPDDIETVDELRIQVNHKYRYQLESEDVLHNFSIPVFRLKQDAIPGRVIEGWFEATQTGTFDVQCAEICGIGHGIMAARIVIEPAADHAAWMSENAPRTVLAATTP